MALSLFKMPAILKKYLSLMVLVMLPSSIALTEPLQSSKSTIMMTASNARRRGLLSSVFSVATTISLQARASIAAPLTTSDLLSQLQRVPTFCIVNSEGAAYMVVKRNEGIAVGYAFLSFEGALAVLADAQRAAEKGGYADLWKDATITTIPADIAIRLALKSSKRYSQKEQDLNTLLNMIPGADDREDALLYDKKFKDQGKVPLFYFDGLQLDDGSTPAYFTKKELITEWVKQHPDVKTTPKVQLLDLVDTFQYVLRGRSDEIPANLLIVPNDKSIELAKELKKKGLAPYKVDRMVI
jgi:hypothetical protein